MVKITQTIYSIFYLICIVALIILMTAAFIVENQILYNMQLLSIVFIGTLSVHFKKAKEQKDLRLKIIILGMALLAIFNFVIAIIRFTW